MKKYVLTVILSVVLVLCVIDYFSVEALASTASCGVAPAHAHAQVQLKHVIALQDVMRVLVTVDLQRAQRGL